MKDSFKAISRIGRGSSCFTTAIDTEHGFFQQRRYDKWLNLWYRVRGKANEWR